MVEHRTRSKAEGVDPMLAHKDFQLRQLRDTVGRIMRGIDGVVKNNADVAVQLQMLYDQHGIKAPSHSVPGSRYGVRCQEKKCGGGAERERGGGA